jgi:hypothetical protein
MKSLAKWFLEGPQICLTVSEFAVVVANVLPKVEVAIYPVAIAVIELCTQNWSPIVSLDRQDNILGTAREAFERYR